MPGCQQAFADFGDAFYVVDGNGLAEFAAEIEQIAERNRRLAAHRVHVAAVDRIAVGGNGGLQHVDQTAIESVGLAAFAKLVEATNGKSDELGEFQAALYASAEQAARDAGEADAGNARLHTGEEFADQRAG